MIQQQVEPEEEEEEFIQNKPVFNHPARAPPGFGSLKRCLQGNGQQMPPAMRAFTEPRFGYDFNQVRFHTGPAATEAARSVNARAFSLGNHVVFGTGEYAPATPDGRCLIAHELAHVVQQGKARELVIRRAPLFPDNTCNSVQGNIRAVWPTAKSWVRVARSRLANPTGVASALQRHFRIDPNDAAHASDLTTVREVFDRMESLFDAGIDNVCTAANVGDECHLPDGRKYGAWVHAGLPQDGITHCLSSADVGFLNRESLIETLVHEMAHLADNRSTDFAYIHEAAVTTYDNMTRAQAIRNGDSYSEFAREMFTGGGRTPLELGLSTGALLSTGRPRWAITASYNIRSRSGIEVFDLVGGVHGFIALDVGAGESEPVVRDLGAMMDVGVISRSADTRVFADIRLGGFYSGDLAGEEPDRAGLTASTMIGWADSGFRAGVNLRALFDFLNGNNAVIIGGEFRWGP